MSSSILDNPAPPHSIAFGEQTAWLVAPFVKFAREFVGWANVWPKAAQGGMNCLKFR